MSDAATVPLDHTLQALRDRERELELEAMAVRARIEEVRSLLEMLTNAQRRRPGRPRKPVVVLGMPGASLSGLQNDGSDNEPDDVA